LEVRNKVGVTIASKAEWYLQTFVCCAPFVLFDIVIIAFVPEENFREMDGWSNGTVGPEKRERPVHWQRSASVCRIVEKRIVALYQINDDRTCLDVATIRRVKMTRGEGRALLNESPRAPNRVAPKWR
jgi:hypothetical protein